MVDYEQNEGLGPGAGGPNPDPSVDEARLAAFIDQFGAAGPTPLKGYDWVCYWPTSLNEARANGGRRPLYGLIRPETERVYVLDGPSYQKEAYFLGYLEPEGPEVASGEEAPTPASGEEPTGEEAPATTDGDAPTGGAYRLTGRRVDGALQFSLEEVQEAGPPITYPMRLKSYDTVTKLFSRNTGLLESDAMLDKRAVLVGCGSVGSFVALELARSGVGHFVLCDADILDIHNICRHQCGFSDLGRYKVDALRDRILNINPYAEVHIFRSFLQRVPEEDLLPLLGRKTILIGGGDNRASADWACKLAIRTDSTFVSIACWTRAYAGEVFYWASGRGLSCYHCALGGLIDEERGDHHDTYFATEEDQENLAFEPGIAADIDFVSLIGVKLALDLLNRDNPDYTPRVIGYLRQYTWICNTNEPKIGGPRAAVFPHPLWITDNLRVNQEADCPDCGAGRAAEADRGGEGVPSGRGLS